MMWSQKDFWEYEKNNKKYNMPYDEVYISCLKTSEGTFFIEHNYKLDNDNISLIKQLENELNS